MGKAEVERNRKNRDKERSLKYRVPKRSYRSSSPRRQGGDEDTLILSDELDINVGSEIPGLKVGDGNLFTRGKRRTSMNTNRRPLERKADPVLIYLKEMGSRRGIWG